ncbi:MAG TPA: RecX family transcriptional regulator [Anaerolineaceae bacterium]|nr:RecX family transcriptional regulator [Anaerolineaceae bacterium]
MKKTITEISAQKRNRRRVNISLDGSYAFSLDRMTAAWLQVGRELSDGEIEQIQMRDEVEVSFNQALNLLSHRSRSVAEMTRYLEGKGYAPGTLKAVLARLEEEGLLNDDRFAREWIENRNTFRPRSQSQLKAELRFKGLAESSIDSALEESGVDDAALAMTAARKQAHRYLSSNYDIYRKRLGNALLRRGFSYATVNDTLRTLWDEMQHTETVESNKLWSN